MPEPENFFWFRGGVRRRSGSLVVMTSALHAEGREFNPRPEYTLFAEPKIGKTLKRRDATRIHGRIASAGTFFRFLFVSSTKEAPRVRLELTTYRLTAGRAADCAIRELYHRSDISILMDQSWGYADPTIVSLKD